MYMYIFFVRFELYKDEILSIPPGFDRGLRFEGIILDIFLIIAIIY
jgi:hypothetical protein